MSCRLLCRIFALFLTAVLLFAVSACRHGNPPAVTDPNRLAADFAAAARTAAGTESPIRIVPATSSRTAAPTRVFVTLPGTARLAAVEDAWRAAAEKDGVKFERAGAGPDAAVYSLTAGGQSLLLLEVFQLEGGSGGAPAEAANSGNGPASALASGAQLAVIVDDLGYDPAAARAALSLPGRVSVAILPNLPDSSAIAEEAFRRGVEVLLHLPMQSLGGDGKAEKIELRVGEPAGEVNRVLGEMLASVPHAVGVNNHQGSRATADAALMAALAGDLRERGLFFIDSRTSGASIALDAARRAGVPAAGRNVFLDDDEQPAAIRKQLERAEHVAREQGFCVAIGHPHNATLDVLAERLPEIEARGVRLVFASEILKSAAGTR